MKRAATCSLLACLYANAAVAQLLKYDNEAQLSDSDMHAHPLQKRGAPTDGRRRCEKH